jgi:hypothetical protein
MDHQFTPKSGSWRIAVEGFFSKLTRQRPRASGAASSDPSSTCTGRHQPINRYLKELNDDPKPFVWTKPAEALLSKLNRLPVPSV